MVEMLTVLVSKISTSQVFLLKNVCSFCICKSYSHFFCKNIWVYAIFNNQSFNDTLTNDIASFEQPDPGCLHTCFGVDYLQSRDCLQYCHSIHTQKFPRGCCPRDYH